VPLHRPRSEARLDPVEELDRERDLRQEHQRLPAEAQRLGDRLEIDLGLPRAGHALQERRRVPAGAHGLAQHRRRLGLRRRQRPRRGGRVEPRVGRVPGRRLADQHPLRLEPLDDAWRDAGELRELARREAEIAELGEGGEHAPARPGHPDRLGARAANERPRGRRRAETRSPGGEPQHHCERRQRVVRGAGQELAHRRPERRGVEHAGHVPELALVEAAVARAPDGPEHPARPERHLDQVPRPGAALGRAVVEQAVEPVGGDHGHTLAGREDAHRRHRRLGQLRVFHRPIPWASIPPDHKG
jgi:hypothetical protein